MAKNYHRDRPKIKKNKVHMANRDEKTRAGAHVATRLKASKFKSQKKYATVHETRYKRRARVTRLTSRQTPLHLIARRSAVRALHSS